MVACTIAARNYLPQVTVLARSFKQHHPGSRFFVLMVDELDSNPTREDSFEVVNLNQIGLAAGDEHRMPLIYDVTELCTAVKPWLLQTLLRTGATAVIYFDPDIEIFAPLDDIGELARQHTIVLTPHVTEPIPRDNLRITESEILAAGIYNLGFIAVGSGSADFLDWWAARLRRDCVIDHSRMRFVDQRWIDFVPGLFPHYILRDPTCNVAYWNLHSRDLTWTGDHYEVNGRPLRFFHYSGYELDKPHLLSKHQGDRPRVLLSDRPGLARICHEYRDKVLAEHFEEKKSVPYGFDSLPGGLKIDRHLRRLYRDELRRFEEGQGAAPPDPFAVRGEEAFIEWLSLASIREKIDSIRALHRFTTTDAEQLRSRLQEIERVLWDTRVNRADATAWARSLESNLQRIRRSAVWKTVKPLWKILNRSRKVESERIDTDLLFEIEAPTEWITGGDEMVISGWCFSPTGRETRRNQSDSWHEGPNRPVRNRAARGFQFSSRDALGA